MEGRGYTDPNPICLTPERRELVFNAAAQGRNERMEEITRLVQRRDEIEDRLQEIDSETFEVGVGALRRERNDLVERSEALETLGDGGPLITVTLDAYGSTLVRRALAGGDAAEAADIVNGALAHSLGADDDHYWPEEAKTAAARREARQDTGVAPISTGAVQYFADGGMAVTLHLKPEPARLLRLACERQGNTPPIEVHMAMAADVRALLGGDGESDREAEAIFDANIPSEKAQALETVPPVPARPVELAVVENELGIHHFTFDYPPTERYCGMHSTVELGNLQRDRARKLAAIFGLDLPAFLKGLIHNNTPLASPGPTGPTTSSGNCSRPNTSNSSAPTRH